MTHPPANPEPLDVIARAMHEIIRKRIPDYPAWEKLNPDVAGHARLIRLAYDRARDFLAMTGRNEE